MNPTEKLAETVESFCHFIEELPREMLVEQDWGPKEVLAHLLFYHEGYGQEIEAQLAADENQIARDHSLGVRTDGCRCSLSLNG